jgi:hypothetical protein
MKHGDTNNTSWEQNLPKSYVEPKPSTNSSATTHYDMIKDPFIIHLLFIKPPSLHIHTSMLG